MSAFCPQSSPTGNLPHLLHILRKPENLGMELKTVPRPQLCMMLVLEICRSKDDPNSCEFVCQYRGKKTLACCMHLLKASHQRGIVIEDAKILGSHLTIQECERHRDKEFCNKNATKDVYIGDSWFRSVASALAIEENSVLAILQVKTATSHHPKKFIESWMKNWPGGSHLVLEATVGSTYKYCKKKTLCFIFNHEASSTKPNIPYVAKCRDETKNPRMHTIPRPECCSTYSQHCNVIDIHNHMLQKLLRLEKHWITHDGFFCTFITVLGICVINCWYGYRHHLKAQYCHKKIEF